MWILQRFSVNLRIPAQCLVLYILLTNERKFNNVYIMYEKGGKKGKRGNGDFKLFGSSGVYIK